MIEIPFILRSPAKSIFDTMSKRSFLSVNIICGALLVFFSSTFAATTGTQPAFLALNGTTNRIVPHCYTPASLAGVQETNPRDCRDAMEILIRQPDFSTFFSFSKNTRRGIKLPRGWISGRCIIFLSCENDRDAHTMRFADVARVARSIIGDW